MHIQVGTKVLAARRTHICVVNEKGVVYDICQLKVREGEIPLYSVIFEMGGYDGFEPVEVQTFLKVLEEVEPTVAHYKFKHVMQLMEDYRRGIFNKAF